MPSLRRDQPYTFVFFNELCPDNYVLWNFREVFATLKLEHVALIEEFIVVKPYFYHKAMDWMTYGIVPKFLKSKTRFLYGYQELCKHLVVSTDALVDHVPPCLYEKELPEESKRSKHGHKEGQQEEQQSDYIKSIRHMVVRPGQQEVNLIEDYEISEIGVPIILKMLVFYLESHEEALSLEGIFRKSVSIDEEDHTIAKLLANNYDYLMEVKNPHVIASTPPPM